MTEHGFSVGDIVVCNDNNGITLIRSREYRIVQVEQYDASTFLTVSRYGVETRGCHESRFSRTCSEYTVQFHDRSDDIVVTGSSDAEAIVHAMRYAHSRNGCTITFHGIRVAQWGDI